LYYIYQRFLNIAQSEREFGCKLVSPSMHVHFGDDYYMFIGSENQSEEVLNSIRASALFVEDMISRYLENYAK